MLLVLQVPIADLRSFQTATAGVVGPGWRLPPDPQRCGFLRGLGGVRRRRNQGAGRVDQWASAAWFVEARSVFKATFATGEPGVHFPRTTAASEKPFGIERVFRRIYSDGGALWHVQLGVQLSLTFPQTQTMFRALVDDVLDLQVQLPPSTADASASPPAPFLKQRKAVVQRVANATTSRRQPPASAGILLSGKPLLYIETDGRYKFADTDPSEYLNITQPLDETGTIKGAPLQLHVDLLRRHKPDECLLLWLESGAARGRDTRNQLRTNLLCLHAELEVLKLVLRKTDSLQSVNAAFERYLAHAYNVMNRAQWLGNDQQVLRNALVAYDKLTGDEAAAVRELLDDRKQTLTRTLETMRAIGVSNLTPNFYIAKADINIGNGGVMNSQMNIGGNVYGNVNYNATINGSQNVVNNISSPDLKAALEQLLAASGKLADALPAAERGRVAALTKEVVDEATAPAPDKVKLQISKDGLIEAAKAVAGMAPSIATAVGAVLGILGFV
ncbi:hypothetical protein [Dyella nitratireducens]|uniref:Uncharacterized protein n=1 Tax=Dyella nitratireducens TaxID=1849580 RepID=A0ABQ1GC58_9GAMM|nr:hypothetical protein [Dyella nitratireducens]GGA40933.1 hypothetical protein GCM10010981_32700 [Dyella nitratireducens]GLQ40628.1 hypothetical protein GCM10007902_04770 [Dyella nitratireducens]